VTRFWADTSTAMPNTLNSSSEWYSPCPALRGAGLRSDRITQAIAAAANTMSSTSASPSIASAPEMIDAGWFRREIASPIDTASARTVTSGTTRSRATVPNRPISSTTSAPPARISRGMNAPQ